MDQILGQLFVAVERFGLFTVVLVLAALGGFFVLYNMSTARKTRSQSQDRIEERKLDLAEEIQKDARAANERVSHIYDRYEAAMIGVLEKVVTQGEELQTWQRDHDARLSTFIRDINRDIQTLLKEVRTLISGHDSNTFS